MRLVDCRCGGTVELVEGQLEDEGKVWARVVCGNCGTEGPIARGMVAHAGFVGNVAMTRWNKLMGVDITLKWTENENGEYWSGPYQVCPDPKHPTNWWCGWAHFTESNAPSALAVSVPICDAVDTMEEAQAYVEQFHRAMVKNLNREGIL